MRVGCRGGPGTDDPTLLVCQNLDLANSVAIAYRLNHYQLSAPDWMQDSRYDVRAKVPEGATKDQVDLMWQNMLADRFKLVIHRETREFQTYDLVVAKGGPKFKEADRSNTNDIPATRGALTFDKNGYPEFGPGHAGMGISHGLARLYNPRMTMARLAGQVSGQLGHPVNDATGLTGAYEIGLYWASEHLAATSPDAGPRLIDALREQLGLRLESKKAPVEFVIVDHAERVHTDN
jgi:uncharacterized protein (TIGR03435 family)